ncbi:hypothetical protein RB608_12040 [Nocardioides sp. LHD-245]|uniref:hypothetical protein n=1 Tax=Nocardioides sp. LHD-245 TaxID=3051387 RepID=UPI0027E0C071|nr:hypothetical protein [Nocardioides sp. LHD-245]
MNVHKIRFQMLMTLDFDQADSALVGRVKAAIRAASDDAVIAAVETTRETRDFATAIRMTAVAGGASEEDGIAIIGAMARQGVA